MSGDDYLSAGDLPRSTSSDGDAAQEPAASNPNHQAAAAENAKKSNASKDDGNGANLTLTATEATSSNNTSPSGPITALDYFAQRGDQQPANPPADSHLRPFVLFHGGIYSNWSKAHKPFEINGESFVCGEQYMMAEKARLFDDWETRKKIMRTNDCRKQKGFGREVKNFKPAIWNKHCDEIVFLGNLAKFGQNMDTIGKEMLATGERIMAEAAPNDSIWGIALHENDKEAQDIREWKGANKLGIACMRVRAQLRKDPNAGWTLAAKSSSSKSVGSDGNVEGSESNIEDGNNDGEKKGKKGRWNKKTG